MKLEGIFIELAEEAIFITLPLLSICHYHWATIRLITFIGREGALSDRTTALTMIDFLVTRETNWEAVWFVIVAVPTLSIAWGILALGDDVLILFVWFLLYMNGSTGVISFRINGSKDNG